MKKFNKKSIDKFAKWLYIVIGLAGVYAVVYMIASHSFFFASMGFFPAIAYILLAIGGINWLVKGLNKNKDLFGN